ncbi:MAG: MBL fold metallo-hydrolase [Clostridia bacterium]|nr:MBL fold metallo-hydrolase [Clostridia bacterium]
MFEPVKVSENCFYLQSPVKIGVVKTAEDRAVLIDSGNDKDAGKRIKKFLDAEGLSLEAIYNTHSHADHIGGNQYLQKQTGCRVYAPGIERDFTAYPVLEPSFLYGAYPPKELRHKFFLAQESDALPLTENCLPDGMTSIPLPGHSWNMVGYRTADGVVFLADCLSSRKTLEKYQICFLMDVRAFLETLEMIGKLDARLFIPSHAEPTEDIVPLAQYNIQKVHEIADAIEKICAEPASFETILRRIFERYALTMTFEQHALVGSTVRSYLTWLENEGRLKPEIRDNTLLWSV